MNRRLFFIWTGILICALILVYYQWTPVIAAQQIQLDQDATQTTEIFSLASEYHDNIPDLRTLTQSADKDVSDILDDPYAVYYTPEELKSFTDFLEGDFGDSYVSTITYELLEGSTGYIRISSFGRHTPEEFSAAITELQSKGTKNLILDLRDNGGGYVDSAMKILSNFIADDVLTIIVNQQGEYHAMRAPPQTPSSLPLLELPIVVLVNNNSASASELLAGALQDYSLATLVGEPTYGKGSVQRIIPLSSGGALKMTVSKYLTPLGRDIEQNGLTPDHFIQTPALQQEVAWQILHPETKPILTLNISSGQAVLNNREFTSPWPLFKTSSNVLMPLRQVLEAMQYQVFWQQGRINIYSGKELVWSVQPDANAASEIIVKYGVSYLTEHALSQLNIDVYRENNKITLTRLK